MIKVGIAGFGKIGKLRYNILKDHPHFEVIGLLDKNLNSPTPKTIKRVSSFSDLIELKIDVVFICSFNDVLADFAIQAIEKGIHVFCEKPPARTVKELEKVKTAFEKSNVTLKYGFNHRYHYSVTEANRIIKEGDFGKLLNFRGVYGKAGSIDYNKNWRNYKKISGGGIVIDQGIHMLDLIRFLSGQEFEVKYSLIKTLFWNIDSEDNAFIILEGDKGSVGSVHSSATQWKHKFLLELTFENGYINLDGILSETRSYAPESLRYGLREFEDITWAMGKPQEHVIWFENDDSWKLEIEEFYRAIAGKGEVLNGTIEDALNTLSLVESVYNS